MEPDEAGGQDLGGLVQAFGSRHVAGIEGIAHARLVGFSGLNRSHGVVTIRNPTTSQRLGRHLTELRNGLIFFWTRRRSYENK